MARLEIHCLGGPWNNSTTHVQAVLEPLSDGKADDLRMQTGEKAAASQAVDTRERAKIDDMDGGQA
jgi:hypothetical protein